MPIGLGASRLPDRRGRLGPLKAAWRILLIGAVALFAAACDPLISPYSAEAYSNATSLKARSLALIVDSGDAYALRQDEVEQLLVDVDAAYEFARGNPRNEIAAGQWAILRNPGGGLLGGYMRKWQADGRVNDFVRTDSYAMIASAFDEIICLEINKSRSADCLGG